MSPTNVPTAISACELTKVFGRLRALDKVSLEVGKGEIFGLLGSNGSGKSTLLRILAGGLQATSGRFELRGRKGYVAQRFGLYEDLLVEENVTFLAAAHDLRGQALKTAVTETLDLFDLSNKRRMRTNELSHGWKHRLAIASALCHDPAILLMDEPTAGIDPVARIATWEIIERVAAKGTAILMATHHIDEAERCHRIGFLQSGTLLTASTPAELTARHYDSHGEDGTLAIALADLVRRSKAA